MCHYLKLSLVALIAFSSMAETGTITGDSLILAGTTPGRLLCGDLVAGSVVVRSTFEAGAAGSVVYEAGKDYGVDLVRGEVVRLAGSRIPDFAANVLYGQENFDHSKFPGYGNLPFFVYVDYATTSGVALASESEQGALLAGSRKKLEAGGRSKS